MIARLRKSGFGRDRVAKHAGIELLPPNEPAGHHKRIEERIENKLLEIGKGQFQDFILKSTLIECEIRILCGAGHVNIRTSTFDRCVFRPRRELKNLRFTGMNLRDCTFWGKYTGCRFGNDLEDHSSDIRGCDFSKAGLFHLCDFIDGADVSSMKWPSWPHIVVTDLQHSRKEWLKLKLPPEMHIIQQVIGRELSFNRAVTLNLPSVTDRSEDLRDVLASQSYIIIHQT